MLRARIAARVLRHGARQLSTTSIAAYPPRRAAGAGGRGSKKDEPPKVVLDEYGMERRPLPPLALNGKPVSSAPIKVVEPKLLKPQPKTRKARAKKVQETVVELDDKAGMTPLERAVREDLERYPDAILLTQVGSFFESYFEQARLVANLLGIKLTSKVFGRATDIASGKKPRHPFSGFPLAQLQKHVSTLIKEGRKVVIVEEFKERGSDVIKRKVTRVVTPGTGIDESFVEMEQMNYVLALGVVDGKSTTEEIGMAYRDIATGASFTRNTKLANLRDDIRLVQPEEVVLDERLQDTKLGERILDLLEGEKRRENLPFSATSTDAVPSSSIAVRSPISAAEDVLLAYLASTLVPTPPPRLKATYVDPATVMQMDSVTLQSLEIRQSLRGGLKGSLIGAVKRTVTPGGQRLLLERLCNPSTYLSVINDRLDLVSTFLDSMHAHRSYFAALLRTLGDTPRVLNRLALRRSHPATDLLALKRTMRALETVHDLVADTVPIDLPAAEAQGIPVEQHRVLYALLDRLGQYRTLADSIETAVDEDALAQREEMEAERQQKAEELGEAYAAKSVDTQEGLWGDEQPWVIRSDFSPALASHHAKLASLRQQAVDLTQTLRERYKAPNLTLRKVLKIGAGVHVLLKDGWSKIEADPNAVMVQKHATTRVYMTQEWVDLHRKIVNTQEKIASLEEEAMQVLVARTLEQYPSLLRTADALAELDVTLGFAELALERQWVRPIINESKSIDIVNGRHPTVEHALAADNRRFDPNSVSFSHPEDGAEEPSLIHVLTGPNMAGKSTYLRQTALIVVLAQAGSFVPATSARIGICDRLYSRVGARDELDRDRSTFMIEMDEATGILNNATSRSLVLFDELGRGTSPIDGLSIAYASLQHLATVNRCRTLFATHYHRLGSLLGYDATDARARGEWEGVEFWCTDIDEGPDYVRFPHTIRRGLNSESGGLTIARLAGMPPSIVLAAQALKDKMMKGEM